MCNFCGESGGPVVAAVSLATDDDECGFQYTTELYERTATWKQMNPKLRVEAVLFLKVACRVFFAET